MRKLSLAIALLMFLLGFVYGQNRQCPTSEAICSFEILSCKPLPSRFPVGQCGNPDQAGCCLVETGSCPITGTPVSTIVCGNSCNP